jgi:hypothetical protein
MELKMIRSLFLALGLYSFLLGVECLVIDKAVMAPGRSGPARAIAASISSPMREVSPADWAPWSLMSAGAVVMLYTVTIPKKMSG